jgi:hypothetical protein
VGRGEGVGVGAGMLDMLDAMSTAGSLKIRRTGKLFAGKGFRLNLSL